MQSRLKRILQKQALSIDAFPEVISAKDVKMELVSQFDWFKDIPTEKLDQLIASIPEKEYQSMADDVNSFVQTQVMNNNTVKAIYTKEFANELRWLLARALYVDKFSIIINLNSSGQAADPAIFSRPLMFSGTLYTARILKKLQSEGYIKWDEKTDLDEYDDGPVSLIPEARVNQIIQEAHNVALKRTLNNTNLVTTIMNKIADSRLNIISDEFWVKHGIRQ